MPLGALLAEAAPVSHYSFGFDTAVQIATDAIDRIRTTADSHGRCMVVEVMGRHVGWIALHAGMASGAHAILIPEQPASIEQISKWASHVQKGGRAPVIVVSEGFRLANMPTPHSHKGLDTFDRPRLGGIGGLIAPAIEEMTGIESRATVLGHMQRGGVPTRVRPGPRDATRHGCRDCRLREPLGR